VGAEKPLTRGDWKLLSSLRGADQEGDMIHYKCNKCGAEMESPDSMIGKMETCPACKRRMKVKDPAVVAEEERRKQEPLKNEPKEEFFCSVAGVTKGGRQQVVGTCVEGEPVFLNREPDNPYDKDAVAVYVERKGLLGGPKYKQVGYIPAEDASDIAYWMDKGYMALGIIRYVVGGEGRESVGLRIAVEIHRK